MSVNRVILVGNLGQDPTLRHTSNGQAVCNISLATNEQWKDSDGNKQTNTQWHRVVTWGKQAENCNQYLKKGRQVYIEGKLQTRMWTDKEGVKQYTTEIQAHRVQFLSSKAAEPVQEQKGLEQNIELDV